MKAEEIQQMYDAGVAELERQRRDGYAAVELRFRRAMIELAQLTAQVVDHYSLTKSSAEKEI